MEIAKSFVAPESPVPGLRYFCLNHGGCGSMYIVELMKANGLGPCYHEKFPDLDDLGIDYFEGKVSSRRVKRWLRLTRRDVFFEASNRLFSMGSCLAEIFPDAKFIHLHRDPRSYLPSGLSAPRALTWDSGRKRYRSVALGAGHGLSDLERYCQFWVAYNERIQTDLAGKDILSVRFDDLINGRIDGLRDFMQEDLRVQQVAPANSNKPIRNSGRYPQFDDWPERDKELVFSTCGPLMKRLGYL
jgi:hypothetical protein